MGIVLLAGLVFPGNDLFAIVLFVPPFYEPASHARDLFTYPGTYRSTSGFRFRGIEHDKRRQPERELRADFLFFRWWESEEHPFENRGFRKTSLEVSVAQLSSRDTLDALAF